MKDVEFVGNLIIEKDKKTFVVDEKVILDLKNIDSNLETGGVLYGYKVRDKEEYIVLGCTFSQPTDIKTNYTFQRNDPNHFKIINDIWKHDNATMYYGDWHFHPVNIVSPSSQDLKSFIKICEKNNTSSKYIINIITARKELRIYIYDKRKKKIFVEYNYQFGGDIDGKNSKIS